MNSAPLRTAITISIAAHVAAIVLVGAPAPPAPLQPHPRGALALRMERGPGGTATVVAAAPSASKPVPDRSATLPIDTAPRGPGVVRRPSAEPADIAPPDWPPSSAEATSDQPIGGIATIRGGLFTGWGGPRANPWRMQSVAATGERLEDPRAARARADTAFALEEAAQRLERFCALRVEDPVCAWRAGTAEQR